MSLSFAIVGDIIPPRDRGKYQGYFGAVFGLASIAGPLLGGLLTEHLSWHWIFYVNLPIGILALIAIAYRLHLPVRKVKFKFDYIGSILMSISLVALLLALTLGGVSYAWSSSMIISLFVASLIFGIAFVYVETKAEQPIIPLRLFRGSIFTISAILSLLSGLILLGTIIFLPEYQQIVRGYSPTESGLLLLPLVGGLFFASLTSGRLITRFGKYKLFPIFGTLVICLGLYLFSQIKLDTSEFTLSIWMIITGIGIGSFMQVMTLAAQNAVDRTDLGTATAIITFFRSIGSSIGTAIFGIILTTTFTTHLTKIFAGSHFNIAQSINNITAGNYNLSTLPATIRIPILSALTLSFRDIFLVAIPFAAVAFFIALLLKETPLKQFTKDEAKADIVGM